MRFSSRSYRTGFYYACVYGSLICLLAIFLLPLIWLLGLSLKTREQIFTRPPLFLWWPTVENYVAVLSEGNFLNSFWNSFLVTASTVLVSLFAGVPAAYTIARYRFAGRQLIFFSLLVMRMLPPIAVLLPLYVMFSLGGLINSRMSLILAYTTFSLPLVVWITRDFFKGVPRDLEEAAYVDGASRFGAFFKIALPLARPGITTAAILSMLLAWNDFIFAAILTNSATRTSPVLLSTYAGSETGTDWGAIAASGILVLVPVIVFSLAVQKHLVSGLSSGPVNDARVR
ncbi:carbohydrate ABC transporter permease [Phyllobacterium endophyticum]|uniref:carbohydrate ABC transporter permease n=1 Tax=Phyllobacterium endophyticum TaxID=1149773 RepID=UPI0011C7636F|nr:carbohydrate ABC transporter permease [Phyllobacterium endophyticum]TXR48416.1 carbohydrate ABC transporter permease [Phyllobacterium endophyticum]